jgi:hypothetical protein
MLRAARHRFKEMVSWEKHAIKVPKLQVDSAGMSMSEGCLAVESGNEGSGASAVSQRGVAQASC